MHELCSITLCQADDSTARLRVETAAGKEQRQWSGRLRGPYCKAARTLAADFPIAADGTLLVTEPCYWTPRLPFTYELQAIAEAPGRGAIELQETVGMRRLEARGRHLLWERRRIVLRGARVDNPANEVLAEAREFEIALLVADPTADFCKQASAQGVPLIADFRNCSGNLPVDVASAARYPAVAAALVDGRQVDATVRFPTDAMLAQAVYPDGVSQLAPWANVAVCEIDPTQRPPDWLADCARPVIGVSAIPGASLDDARRRCDQLQARLAPEFDLAGYFA